MEELKAYSLETSENKRIFLEILKESGFVADWDAYISKKYEFDPTYLFGAVKMTDEGKPYLVVYPPHINKVQISSEGVKRITFKENRQIRRDHSKLVKLAREFKLFQ